MILLLAVIFFFSISLFSVDEDELLFQHHHSPAVLSEDSIGVYTVGTDSIYRVGSRSKVFSVRTFLIEASDSYFNGPITR